jgi:hypothetical protein
MRGFSYLYSLFFVGFLSLIVVSYFTTVSVSYLTQKGVLNNEYYDSISREFLSVLLNQLIKKINYSPYKIEKIEELGIYDDSVYLLKIKEVNSQAKIKIIKEVMKKNGDYNNIDVILRIIIKTNLLNIKKTYSADIKLTIISGKLSYYFFPLIGELIENIYFYPFHNMKLYNNIKPEIYLDINELIKKIYKREQKADYLTLRESLNLKKVNIPVVDGLYIGEIKGEKYLYFKGCIDSIILGKSKDYQFIYATQGENSLMLKYNNITQDIIAEKNGLSERLHGKFNGTLLIEGDVGEVSSGEIIGSSVVRSDDVPAVCDGEEINFIIAGNLKINSSLKYEDISIEKGRFKREKTKLNLIQSDKKLFEDKKIKTETSVYGKELHGNYYFPSYVYIEGKPDIFGSIYIKDEEYEKLKIFEDPLNYRDNLINIAKTKGDWTIIKNMKLLKIGEEE